ncbi:MAG: ABC transporter permease subunit [Bacillales bacterium]|nr:ABC transporter permease subunit [Bacillales bacterium]
MKIILKKKKEKSYSTGKGLILFLIPTVVYLLIFHYLPMSGLVIAFEDYNSYQGIFGSPLAKNYGFANFINFFNMPNFWLIIKNTLVISVYSIVVNTILPIILALFINEIRNKHFKKTVQTISYAPYFVSTVVCVGMIFAFSNYEHGIFNTIAKFFGGKPSNMLESDTWFSTIYVVSGLWQGLGWWAIIYVGALANANMELHEAAVLDGANRLQRIWHINLPTIIPMAIIMFILSVGNILSVGFEKVFLMQTSGNLGASEILSTYTYRVSLMSRIPQYSYATAIGLFNSVVSMVMLIAVNKIAKKVGDTSLW